MTKRGGARAHALIDRAVPTPEIDTSKKPSSAGLFDYSVPMLFLVDGNNLLWRAAHGRKAPFDADDGRDLTPLFRFFAKLRRALGTYGLFGECIVCFDGADAWAERVELDTTYKSNRRYDDADLSFMGWLPEIRGALDAVGVLNYEIEDREADDVIATLAANAGSREVRILSTDRDYFQLIGPTTFVVNPRGRPALISDTSLFARHGVRPDQWCDFRALAGDPSDGICGVPGIGMTKAARMLAGGKKLEDVRAEVAEHWDDVKRWRELIRLRADVDLDRTPSCAPTPPLPSASAVCAGLGLVR